MRAVIRKHVVKQIVLNLRFRIDFVELCANSNIHGKNNVSPTDYPRHFTWPQQIYQCQKCRMDCTLVCACCANTVVHIACAIYAWRQCMPRAENIRRGQTLNHPQHKRSNIVGWCKLNRYLITSRPLSLEVDVGLTIIVPSKNLQDSGYRGVGHCASPSKFRTQPARR